MTGVPRRRWKIIAEKLAVARERGHLGVIAATTKVAEYKLHDLAKYESGEPRPVSPHELRKLYEYFKGKK